MLIQLIFEDSPHLPITVFRNIERDIDLLERLEIGNHDIPRRKINYREVIIDYTPPSTDSSSIKYTIKDFIRKSKGGNLVKVAEKQYSRSNLRDFLSKSSN